MAITGIGASLNPDAPVELIDTRTGQRIPYWAELDATDPDPATLGVHHGEHVEPDRAGSAHARPGVRRAGRTG
ncbi:MAG: hypothetical protein JO345_32575 [Streptosporangiaceae bacterium]|nr:hypothetical protein [Streptosporangiaceae bacterium]